MIRGKCVYAFGRSLQRTNAANLITGIQVEHVVEGSYRRRSRLGLEILREVRKQVVVEHWPPLYVGLCACVCVQGLTIGLFLEKPGLDTSMYFHFSVHPLSPNCSVLILHQLTTACISQNYFYTCYRNCLHLFPSGTHNVCRWKQQWLDDWKKTAWEPEFPVETKWDARYIKCTAIVLFYMIYFCSYGCAGFPLRNSVSRCGYWIHNMISQSLLSDELSLADIDTSCLKIDSVTIQWHSLNIWFLLCDIDPGSFFTVG